MLEIAKGMGLLVVVLILFSGFSLKAPKGHKAMTGLAGAAVATYLVEVIHKYISGELLHISFLGEVGNASGSIGGPIATILVSLNMGVNPVYAVVAGATTAQVGILPGFMAGYVVGVIGPILERRLPKGLDLIIGALLIAPFARGIANITTPIVNHTLINIGNMISIAAEQSPYMMGFLLGGIIKVICTSPLSSMALTAMLGLQGLAMGIAAIASYGGAFTNGVVFKRLKLGNSSNIIAVMLEPLTQADIVTKHPFPIYFSDFIGGGLTGLAAAHFRIINNAPGTASPIPGMLAPFGFNHPINVAFALLFATLGGLIGGYIGTSLILFIKKKNLVGSNKRTMLENIHSEETFV